MKIKLYTLHQDTQQCVETLVFTSRAERDTAADELVLAYDPDRHALAAACELSEPAWLEHWREFSSDQLDYMNHFHLDESEVDLPGVLTNALTALAGTLADEEAGNDEVRDRALDVCGAAGCLNEEEAS